MAEVGSLERWLQHKRRRLAARFRLVAGTELRNSEVGLLLLGVAIGVVVGLGPSSKVSAISFSVVLMRCESTKELFCKLITSKKEIIAALDEPLLWFACF